jgi:uncharacterized protein (DUF305 family)
MTHADTAPDEEDLRPEQDEPPVDAADEDDDPNAEQDSALARWVGSDESMLWLKRITMGLALAFLVGALGYFIGVRTTEPPGNAVDVGFLRDMTDHHDQAVRMAQSELANGSDAVTKGFAMEIIMFQRQELGRIQNFQDELGVVHPEYGPDRETMEWMGMSTPLNSMPGMATEEQLKQLDAAKGVEADKLFLILMQTHHTGGAHMADYEAENGADPKIRDMAERMARSQRIEVKEYQGVIDRLNGKK